MNFGITANDAIITIPAQRSRLNALFVSFWKPSGNYKNASTYFYYPQNEPSTGLESFVQLGDAKTPDNEYRGAVEHFYRAQKAFGYTQSSAHSMSTTIEAYSSDSATLIYDMETIPGSGASHTGKNTFGGNLTLSLRGMGSSSADAPTVCHVVLFFDELLSIEDGGATVAM